MKIERSRTGIYRLSLSGGWAVGFGWGCPLWMYAGTYPGGGWSLRVLWFHVGRKCDRCNWGHWT